MEAILTVILVVLFLAAGMIYLRFCKRMSEYLTSTIKFCRKTEREGGDNWPEIQLDMGGFGGCDDLTYEDFEENDAEAGPEKKELCGHLH